MGTSNYGITTKSAENKHISRERAGYDTNMILVERGILSKGINRIPPYIKAWERKKNQIQ